MTHWHIGRSDTIRLLNNFTLCLIASGTLASPPASPQPFLLTSLCLSFVVTEFFWDFIFVVASVKLHDQTALKDGQGQAWMNGKFN